ncbi:MAG: SCO family protein [Proteobacteria bacterium]|nr:SCO family protein [Pseudomonadota bacterium]
MVCISMEGRGIFNRQKRKRIVIALIIALISIVTTASLYKHVRAESQNDIFINQNGKEVSLSDFNGKVVLMDFIQAECPRRGCNLLSLQFLKVQLLLKNRIGKDLFLLSVSIEPETDSPEILKTYAEKYKADPNGWFFLTGANKAIERLMKKYGVTWVELKDGSLSHKTITVLLDRQERLVNTYINPQADAEAIIRDIRAIID